MIISRLNTNLELRSSTVFEQCVKADVVVLGGAIFSI